MNSPENQRELDSPAPDAQWERDLLNRLAFASLNEQRRARRWNIFFKSLLFAYLLVILFIALPFPIAGDKGDGGKHAALVELNGMIADGTQANADRVARALRSAFRDKGTVGVILRINSPGGSPVQSGILYDEIRRLREQHPDTPIYAVVMDLCASGGYYVASGTDGIYANRASLIGSIGVLMNGFGFVEAMEKLGIERRLLTAGENKGLLDPFSPMRPEDTTHVQGLLDRIHGQFVQAVKEGRGDRLKADKIVFSGLVWTGEEAMELGLIDGLASPGQVARELLGTEKLVDFTPKPHYLELFADRFGATLVRIFTGGENLLR